MSYARPEINLFGSPRLVVDGGVIDRLPTQRVAAVLAYLALHTGWQSREVVAEAIWPEQPEGKGLASLRNALSMLRRVLEPSSTAGSILETTRTQVRLSRVACICDVWVFQNAISGRDQPRAVSVYEGDVLPDIHDEWLGPIREGLRNSFIGAVSHEARRALAAGEPEQAIALAERWRTCDPYDSEALRVMVLGLAGAGRARTAISALEKFVEEDLENFGGDPTFDVSSLRSQIEARARLASPIALKEPSRETPRQEAKSPRLPTYLSRFYGREQELEQVREWAEGPSQLLTIVGPGGIGKTRLAIEAMRPSQNAIFVSLADADSRDDLISGLMGAFELRESETATPEQVIDAYLSQSEGPIVVILDNLEQFAGIAAALVLDLLPANRGLKFLCTSREVLGLEGEQLLPLSPLETAIGTGDFAATVRDHAAIQMFLDRARNSRADFALTDRNYRDVAALCQELDGLPLAIEIMAGWSGTWTVTEMRQNVRNSQVVARKRGHDPRHRSLDACIEWSFDLLDAETRSFLCLLSLFRGGWTLEAAEAVSGRADAAERLAALVDRSLVSSTEIEVGLRFFMMGSVGSYCRTKLTEPDIRNAAKRFIEYFEGLGQTLSNPYVGAVEGLNHRKLDRERENIEAAVSLCEDGVASVESGLKLLGRLHIHWGYRGQARAGMALIDRLLAVPTDEPPGFGRILGLQTFSVLAQETNDLDRAEQAIRALQIVAEEQTDLEIRFRVLNQIGNFFNTFGRYEPGLVQHTTALGVARQMQNQRMEAVSTCNMAEAFFGLDQVEEAIKFWQISTDLDRATGNTGGDSMMFLGFAKVLTGELKEGAALLRGYLANTFEIGFGRGYAKAVHFTALLAAEVGDIQLANDLKASAVAYAESSSQMYDTSDRRCFDIVDRAIAKSNSTGLATRPVVDILEAVGLADRFLASVEKGSAYREADPYYTIGVL